MGGDFKMINDNAQEEMEELVQDIMKHKSVSLLEAASIANKFLLFLILSATYFSYVKFPK